MTSHASPTPEELLAAYADDGLEPAEIARVEAYLAQHPDARSQVDDIRALLTSVREHPPRPQVEPDWTAMSVDIANACDEAAPAGWWARLRAWLATPRNAVGAIGLVAAAAVLLALAFNWPGSDSAGPGVAQDEIRAPGETDGDGDDPALEQALDDALADGLAALEGDVEDLDDEVLDTLFEALDPTAVDMEEEQELALAGERVLSEDVLADWLGSEDPLGSESIDDEYDADALDSFDDSDWLEDLSERELDQLDSVITEMMAS